MSEMQMKRALWSLEELFARLDPSFPMPAHNVIRNHSSLDIYIFSVLQGIWGQVQSWGGWLLVALIVGLLVRRALASRRSTNALNTEPEFVPPTQTSPTVSEQEANTDSAPQPTNAELAAIRAAQQEAFAAKAAAAALARAQAQAANNVASLERITKGVSVVDRDGDDETRPFDGKRKFTVKPKERLRRGGFNPMGGGGGGGGYRPSGSMRRTGGGGG